MINSGGKTNSLGLAEQQPDCNHPSPQKGHALQSVALSPPSNHPHWSMVPHHFLKLHWTSISWGPMIVCSPFRSVPGIPSEHWAGKSPEIVTDLVIRFLEYRQEGCIFPLLQHCPVCHTSCTTPPLLLLHSWCFTIFKLQLHSQGYLLGLFSGHIWCCPLPCQQIRCHSIIHVQCLLKMPPQVCQFVFNSLQQLSWLIQDGGHVLFPLSLFTFLNKPPCLFSSPIIFHFRQQAIPPLLSSTAHLPCLHWATYTHLAN